MNVHGPLACSHAAIAPASKLDKAAQEFEAILIQSWLEKMNVNFLGSPDGQDPAHDTVSSLGTQAIATALSARGGIGIARMLVRQVQAREHTSHRDVRSQQPGSGLELKNSVQH